ncbi:hypothetical protein HZ326_23275 [Fusarium oxysporum f. sp. albedinis]|nr:hypothetical protein HZ326_23275 [Fusarium oxysporum f. sp. albedinis]
MRAGRLPPRMPIRSFSRSLWTSSNYPRILLRSGMLKDEAMVTRTSTSSMGYVQNLEQNDFSFFYKKDTDMSIMSKRDLHKIRILQSISYRIKSVQLLPCQHSLSELDFLKYILGYLNGGFGHGISSLHLQTILKLLVFLPSLRNDYEAE